MRTHLNRSELEALHSVLRRAAERAEARKLAGDPSADAEAEMLAQAVADLNDELARAE
jgi:hypothetical protein